jgi:predicted XRE-type DNA-binding protein
MARRTSPNRRHSRIDFEESSCNVFADLGLPNPERELLKARLTLEIYRIVKERHLTQASAGALLGIKQPHVSLLVRNRAGRFSVERLMDFLAALGQDVEITVRPRARSMAPSHDRVGLMIRSTSPTTAPRTARPINDNQSARPMGTPWQ